jgi:hypothetical protein
MVESGRWFFAGGTWMICQKFHSIALKSFAIFTSYQSKFIDRSRDLDNVTFTEVLLIFSSDSFSSKVLFAVSNQNNFALFAEL